MLVSETIRLVAHFLVLFAVWPPNGSYFMILGFCGPMSLVVTPLIMSEGFEQNIQIRRKLRVEGELCEVRKNGYQ